MANQNQIRFNVGFDIDKSNLGDLRASLQELQQMTATMFRNANPGKNFDDVNAELVEIKNTAEIVESALTQAFNPKLGTINITTFNNALKSSQTSIKDIYTSFSKAGTAGQIAFQKMATSVLTTNTQLKQSKTILDNMATTLANTVKWNLASAAVNKLAGSVQQAYGYVKSLDGSLNDIMIVTQKSAEEMDKFADSANKAAQNLGRTTTDYTNASLTFYQQGLNDTEVAARTDLTLKVANASGLDAEESAQYVTAVLNAYKVGAEEAEAAMDILANVGAHTASSLSELSKGMSKVASSANAMGVSEEKLAAMLATTISVTRQEAASIGTAYKTIFARISDIEAGTEDAEVSLGNYTKQMATMGVNVLDSTGKLRNLEDVLEDIGSGWKDMTREQQISLAQTMAGTRQYNNLIALFDNWDSYVETLKYANNATGTLQQQQDTYMQSTEAHLNQLKAAEEDLFDSLLDSKTINSFADGMAKVVKFTASWVDALGGGGKTLLALGSIATSVFSNQIAKGFGTMISNAQKAKMSVDEIKTQMSMIPEFKTLGDDAITKMAKMKEQVLSYGNLVSQEQMEETNGYIKQISELEQKKKAINDNTEAAQAFLNQVQNVNIPGISGDIDTKAFESYKNAYNSESKEVNEKATSDYEKLNLVLSQLNDKITDSKDGMQKLTKAMRENYGDTEESANAIGKLIDANNNEINSTNEILKLANKKSEAYKKLINIQQDLIDNDGNIDTTILQSLKPEQLEQFNTAYQKILEEIRQKVQVTTEVNGQNYYHEGQKAGEAADHIKNKFEQVINTLKSTEAIQGLTKMIGGIGQLASALNTLSNINNIFNDENLTVGEKTLRIVQALAMGLPMLVTGLSSTIQGVNLLRKDLPSLVANLAVSAGATGVQAGANATLGASFISLLSVTWPYILAIGALAVAIIGIVAIVKTSVKAHEASKIAMQEANEQAKELSKSYEELTNKVNEFKDASSNYDEAVAAFEKLDKSAEDYKDKLEEANSAARHLIEQYKLFDSYHIDSRGLIQFNVDENGNSVLDNIQTDLETKANNAKANLAGANIVIETTKFNNLLNNTTRNFGTLRQIDDNIIYDENGDISVSSVANTSTPAQILDEEVLKIAHTISSFSESVLNDEEKFKEALQNTDFGDLSKIVNDNIDAFTRHKDELINLAKAEKDMSSANEYYAKELVSAEVGKQLGNAISSRSGGDSAREDLISSAVAQYIVSQNNGVSEYITQRVADIAGINSTNDLTNYLNNNELSLGTDAVGNTLSATDDRSLAMAYAALVKGVEDTGSLIYESGNGKGTVKTENGEIIFEDMNDEAMRRAVARMALVNKAIEENLDNLSKNTNIQEFTNNLFDLSDKADKAGKQYGINFTNSLISSIANGDLTSFNFSDIFANIKPEDIENFQDLSINDILEMFGFSSLSEAEDSFKKLGFDSAESFVNAWNEGMSKYDPSDWEKRIRESVSAAKADVESLIIDMQAGKLDSSNIAENEQYNDLLQRLDDIVEKDKDLEAASEILKKTWLAGTQEYIEALEYVQDRLYGLDMESFVNNAKESYDKVKEYFKDGKVPLEADTEGFEEAMEDLLNKNYQIDVAVHAEAEQEFDSFVAGLTNASNMASKIGENFIVAGEDLRELNNAFPGVLEGMQFLADGTVQLNEQIVQSAMESAEAEAKADAQATIDKLKDQAILLRQKQATYEKMAEAAAYLAKAEVDTDTEANEAKEALSAGLAEIEQLNKKASTEYAMDSDVDIANSSNESASVVSANWNEAYNNAALAAWEAANRQIDAANAVEAGAKLGEFKEINIAYKGSTKQGSEARVLNDTKDYIEGTKTASDEVWASLANQYRQLAESAGIAANDVEGMIYEVSARLQNADAGFGNISRGYGSKGPSSSGSSSSKESKILDYSDDDLDRYHDINIQITLLTRNLDRLKKAQDKLVGKELINNLNKQLSILEKQRDAYAAKIKIAREEAAELKDALAQSGATFYNNGEIANYAQLLTDTENELNKTIAWFNSLSADAQDDLAQGVVDAAQQNYDNLKETIERYEEVINDVIPDLEDEITDALYEEISIHIEKLDMDLQIHLDMSDAERSWNEFKKKVIDGISADDILGRATSARNDWLTYYSTRNSAGNIISDRGSVQAATDKINDILGDLYSMDAGGHGKIYSAYDENTGTWVDDRAGAMAALKETYADLMGQLEALVDLQDEVQQAFLDSIDAVQDAFDKQSEVYEFFGDQIDHDIKMVQMLYGDDAFDKLNEFYEKQVDSDLAQVNNLKKQVDYWRELMDAARGTGDDDAYAKYRDNWMKTINDLNSKIEDWADDLANAYENTINNIINELNNNLTDGLGLDYVGEELKLLQDNADDYLDTINRAYALEDLQAKWDDAIDATDSIAAQKELNKLMEKQMNYLKEKGELTQYDIDRAEKEYEIALKQIALQEAQRSKTKMRLRRDSQGNYTYQFVTDEEQVSNARQELLAAQNDLYNFDKDAYNNNLNEIYDVWKEFQDKIKQAYIDFADDEEGRTRQLALLQEQYGEKLNRLTEQNTTIRSNLEDSAFQALTGMYDNDVNQFENMTEEEKALLQGLAAAQVQKNKDMSEDEQAFFEQIAGMYGKNVQDFQNMTEEEKNALMNDLIPTWNSGVQQMATKITEATGDMEDEFAGEGGFSDIVEQAFADMDKAASDYNAKQGEIKSTIQDIHEQIYEEQEALQTESGNAIDAAKDEYDAVKAVRSQVRKLIEEYGKVRQAAIDAATAAYDYWQKDMALAAEAAKVKADAADKAAEAQIQAANKAAAAQVQAAQQVAAANAAAATAPTPAPTTTPSTSSSSNGSYELDWLHYDEQVGEYLHDLQVAAGNLIEEEKKKASGGTAKFSQGGNTVYQAFATGGLANYTGPAWLDGTPSRPELVLNQNDTQNMFAALKVLDSIVNGIGLSALGIAADRLSGLNGTNSFTNNSNEPLEQTVYITAQFEGQTSADEIQTALNNLVNTASQRAYRNKR